MVEFIKDHDFWAWFTLSLCVLILAWGFKS